MKSEVRFSEIAKLRKETVQPRDFLDAKYVGLEHISQGTLQLTGNGFGSDVDSQKQRFYKGDILFGKLRPYFRKVVKAPFDGICSTDIWVVDGKIPSDNDFIKYWMASESFIQSSTGAAEGSRMPRAQWDWVSNFTCSITNPVIREAIGKTLAQLDEKIRVNQQIASTLEQIAQTIFKSWFVDFDPVQAKARGEQPVGMDAETAALFPDSFEESELGPIPSGWNLSEIGKTLSLVGGSTPSTANSDYWDGDYTWTTPKDLSNQEGLITVGSARKITEKGLAKITSGLLEKGSVLMSSRAPIGYLAIADVPTAVNQGFIAFPPTKDFHPMYVLNWLRINMFEIKNRAGGSSFAEVSKAAFKTLPMLVPHSQIVEKYGEIAQPILEQLSQITYQNRTLRDLRDSLLPRLITGELEIPAELLEA